MAGAEAEPAACAGPNLAAGNRCAVAAQVFKGMGNEPLIDDMEPSAGESPECHKIRSVDGRQGIWNFGKDATSPNGAVTFKLEAPGAGGAPNSTRAIHFTGQGLNGYGGYLATPLAPCYDASAVFGNQLLVEGRPLQGARGEALIHHTPHGAGGRGGQLSGLRRHGMLRPRHGPLLQGLDHLDPLRHYLAAASSILGGQCEVPP